MEDDDIFQRVRERRLTTLALADQIKEDRWREPLLPGGRGIHEVLSHLLAWDEWAVAVFEISQLRALPPVLIEAVRDVDAYNARAVKRFRNISRDDMLTALESTPNRVLAGAVGPGGAEWESRSFPDLAVEGSPFISREGPTPIPTVGRILRRLNRHETRHDEEIIQAFGITANLDRFREQQESH